MQDTKGPGMNEPFTKDTVRVVHHRPVTFKSLRFKRRHEGESWRQQRRAMTASMRKGPGMPFGMTHSTARAVRRVLRMQIMLDGEWFEGLTGTVIKEAIR